MKTPGGGGVLNTKISMVQNENKHVKFVALVSKWISLSAKFGIKMALLFKSQQHAPTQIILSSPTPLPNPVGLI